MSQQSTTDTSGLQGTERRDENRFRWQKTEKGVRTWVIMYPTNHEEARRETLEMKIFQGSKDASEEELKSAQEAQESLTELYAALMRSAKVAVDQNGQSEDLSAIED